MAGKKRGAGQTLLKTWTVRGNNVGLPKGCEQAGMDEMGRYIYTNKRVDRTYALQRVQGGWSVFEFLGCGCNG